MYRNKTHTNNGISETLPQLDSQTGVRGHPTPCNCQAVSHHLRPCLHDIRAAPPLGLPRACTQNPKRTHASVKSAASTASSAAGRPPWTPSKKSLRKPHAPMRVPNAARTSAMAEGGTWATGATTRRGGLAGDQTPPRRWTHGKTPHGWRQLGKRSVWAGSLDARLVSSVDPTRWTNQNATKHEQKKVNRRRHGHGGCASDGRGSGPTATRQRTDWGADAHAKGIGKQGKRRHGHARGHPDDHDVGDMSKHQGIGVEGDGHEQQGDVLVTPSWCHEGRQPCCTLP